MGTIGSIRDGSCLINTNLYQFVATADSAIAKFLFQEFRAADFRLLFAETLYAEDISALRFPF
jgi:hypothetical protein